MMSFLFRIQTVAHRQWLCNEFTRSQLFCINFHIDHFMSITHFTHSLNSINLRVSVFDISMRIISLEDMETCFVFDFDLFSNPRLNFTLFPVVFLSSKIRRENLQLNLKGWPRYGEFVCGFKKNNRDRNQENETCDERERRDTKK